MIIDIKTTPNLRGVLLDAATRQRIPFACWANLDTGEYVAFKATPDGKDQLWPPEKYSGRAQRLEFVGDVAPPIRAQVTSAVDPAAALKEVAEYRQRISQKDLVPGEECEERGCHALSEFLVADVRSLQPVRLGSHVYERRVIVRQHAYCQKHYRRPVGVSPRGVEGELSVINGCPERFSQRPA